MCREIITGLGCNVRRPDASQILAIRNGAWTYDQLMEWATKEDAELLQVVKTSSLPKAPDRVKLNDLCIQITEMVPG